MPKQVSEVHRELWHYTTAAGLHGILKTQQLWATNILYLNDAEELTGFFDRKLPQLIRKGVTKGIAQLGRSQQVIAAIRAAGGLSQLEDSLTAEFGSVLRKATLNLQIYVASFCHTPEEIANEGLLSQWRGYGPDGGYALVFDTARLGELLHAEGQRFFYSKLDLGNADYHDERNDPYEETIEWDSAVQKAVSDALIKRNQHFGLNLFEPLVSLATRHKHRGFREECEVRIVTLIPDEKLIVEARIHGEKRERKKLQFISREGLLVPHIDLFGCFPDQATRLPISKIVVGPHPDKIKRQQVIRHLLDELKIKADVVISDIPYIGR
jgi:Protein of unknown function (DUF2971)